MKKQSFLSKAEMKNIIGGSVKNSNSPNSLRCHIVCENDITFDVPFCDIGVVCAVISCSCDNS